MRKMIMMAIAGFIWKEFQSRAAKPRISTRGMRRS